MIVAGGCHCGAVRFEIDVEEEVELLDCNCSICSKTGYLHLMVAEDRFSLQSGTDGLTSYRFGTGAAEHLFCNTCGIKCYYRPRSHPGSLSVNFRCLEDGHGLRSTTVRFDGKDWEQAHNRLAD